LAVRDTFAIAALASKGASPAPTAAASGSVYVSPGTASQLCRPRLAEDIRRDALALVPPWQIVST
jgi:hypothetical protein